MGHKGSPLICGHSSFHEELVQKLAKLKNSESAILFPCGYSANLGVLQSLGGIDCEIFSDSLNHASIIDGCRLASQKGSKITVYAHRNLDDLEMKLTNSARNRKIIISDSVFSMDGDLCDLAGLCHLKEKYSAFLGLDDAHSTFIYGENGGGIAELLNLSDKVDFYIGTLSKAIAAQGGFICGSANLISYLCSTARPFIFSTAFPIPIAAFILKNMEILEKDKNIRKKLWRNIEKLARFLGKPLNSPIVPIVLGDESKALSASTKLLEMGIHITAIRPPTVPPGSCRLRLTLSAAHNEEELQKLFKGLEVVLKGSMNA